jgi:hypothetical protein
MAAQPPFANDAASATADTTDADTASESSDGEKADDASETAASETMRRGVTGTVHRVTKLDTKDWQQVHWDAARRRAGAWQQAAPG